MVQSETPPNYLHDVAEQDGNTALFEDSQLLLCLSEEITGSKDPKNALEIGYNLLHPEKPINRESWGKVNWQEKVTMERQQAASQVIGTLLMNRAYSDSDSANIDRIVIGLPTNIDGKVSIPELDIDKIAETTGLGRGRVIHRRYEAIDILSRIWKNEIGVHTPHESWQIKKQLIPKIFETYGQLGYSLIEAMYRDDASYPFIYLDKVFNGENQDNPLFNLYSNGIAGYNRNAGYGRDTIIAHLEQSEFRGSQNLLDSEAINNLAPLQEMGDKLSYFERLFHMSGKKQTGWLAEARETLDINKTNNFTQVEAFKIAELKKALETFKPENNQLAVFKEIVDSEEQIRLVVEAYGTLKKPITAGLELVEKLLNGSTTEELASEYRTNKTDISAKLWHGLNVVKNIKTKLTESDLNLETVKSILTDPKNHTKEPRAKDKLKKVPKIPKKVPVKEIISPYKPTMHVPEVVYDGPVEPINISLLVGEATPENREIRRLTPGSKENADKRVANLLNKHFASYEAGEYEQIPLAVKKALDAWFGIE